MHYSDLFLKRIIAIFKSAIFFLSIMSFSCQMGVRETILPPPKELIPEPQQIRVGKLSPQQLEYVNDMLDRLDISYQPKVEKEDYSYQIRHCLSFLVKEFGPPIYKGRVTLSISADPKDNGKMSWSDRRRNYRTVTLHEFCFYAPSEFHVLVHELFHAFYQTNEFIKTNPDFIIEGLATYAEYKYRYLNKKNDEILQIMRQQIVALSHLVEDKPINFNTPFQAYGDPEIDLSYILSGMLFYSQDSTTINEKINNMLEIGSKFKSRKYFDELVKVYGLIRTEYFLKEGTTIALQLPNVPKKVQHLNKNSDLNSFDQGESIKIPPKINGKRYYIQINFYSEENRSLANSNADKYEKIGYPAKVMKHPEKSGWILVLGPYHKMTQAEKVIHELKKTDSAAHEKIFYRLF